MIGNLISFSVLIIAVLAILIRLNPEIVLKVPNGFILYAIMGHTPPPYFDMSGTFFVDTRQRFFNDRKNNIYFHKKIATQYN